MLLRTRWFTLGMVASLGAVAYAANQVRRVGQRLTPQNLTREAGYGLAGGLDAMAHLIAPRDRPD